MPAYYPAFIDVRDRACVVIGGGDIGEEKVFKLLECNARVRVIGPEISHGVQELVDGDRVTWVRREYRQGDLEGAFIAIAAINDNGVNMQIAQEAERRNVLLNVVDVTHLCTFIAPSVVRRGEVAIAASTGGASPALARKFREVLSGSPVESSHSVMDYAELAPLLADVRSQIRRFQHKAQPGPLAGVHHGFPRGYGEVRQPRRCQRGAACRPDGRRNLRLRERRLQDVGRQERASLSTEPRPMTRRSLRTLPEK